MAADGQRALIDREARRPLYVQVITDPPLGDCWSVNLSSAGVGLVATATPQTILEEGDALTLELTLPDSGARLCASGRVAWRRLAPGRGADRAPSLALGVRFDELSADSSLTVQRFLAEFRPRVVVRGASLGQRDCLTRTLRDEADVRVAESDEEALALLAGGDVAALVLCAQGREDAPPLVEHFAAALAELAGVNGPLSDLGPRLLYYGPADAPDLVRLFNQHKLASALRRSAEDDEVRAAVLEACRDHGVRNERHRAALAFARSSLRERARRRPADEEHGVARSVVAESREMRDVVELARSIAGHRVTVLLEGETGTGKEVMARAIHDLSDRADGPFVVQDCGTLTETLLDSELFGHVRGAFTGAVSDHPGLFVLADGGTVFLDEVENTTPALQAKLLRVLELGEVRPVGGTKMRKVDVRVVCATNSDLAAAAREGRFRADLYYRLNTFPIRLPPLRERRDDIVPLARHFRAIALGTLGVEAGDFTAEAERLLTAHDWPGNVRELKNVVERALVLAADGALGVDVLPPSLVEAARGAGVVAVRERTLQERLDGFERDLIARALRDGGGVLQRAAEALGVNRITLARRARRYGLWGTRED